jgi:scyllo-inositol 2-dehydrogenase (NAD+)
VIRGAIVGFGKLASGSGKHKADFPRIWQPLSLIGGIESIPIATLAAVCDTNVESMSQIRSGVTKYYNHQELLMKEKIDFLAIATRAPLRIEIAKDAVNANITKLHLEKPLCNDARTLSDFKQLVKNNKVKFTYGAIRRLLEPYRLVKSFIDSKVFGSLSEIVINYGVSELFWTHTHTIDLILYFIESNAKISKIKGKSSDITFVSSEKSFIVETDPIILDLSLMFNNNQRVRITDIGDQSIDLYFDHGIVQILNNGRSVVLKSKTNSLETKHILWSESDLRVVEGFAAPLNMLIASNAGLPDVDSTLVKNMDDAILGQEILFLIAEKLLKAKNPGMNLPKNPIYLGRGGITNLPA